MRSGHVTKELIEKTLTSREELKQKGMIIVRDKKTEDITNYRMRY